MRRMPSVFTGASSGSALTAAGVGASNTPDVLNETVADYAWAMMLAAARRVGEAERLLYRRYFILGGVA